MMWLTAGGGRTKHLLSFFSVFVVCFSEKGTVTYSAVSPSRVREETFAPFSNKYFSNSVIPCHAAKWSAVELLLACDSKSTPASTNSLATSSCFCQIAACNGVNCSRLCILGLQPAMQCAVRCRFTSRGVALAGSNLCNLGLQPTLA